MFVYKVIMKANIVYSYFMKAIRDLWAKLNKVFTNHLVNTKSRLKHWFLQDYES